MPQLRTRVLTALAFGVFSTAAFSQSQTTLNLTYTPAGGPPAKVCQFTTDANGLAFDSTTGTVSATGSFVGTGCPTGGTGGGGPTVVDGLEGDVSSTLSIAQGGSVNATLTWNVNADTCEYSGTLNGQTFANWGPVGASACGTTGTGSCATNHSTTLPLSVAGTYDFSLTCHRNSINVTTHQVTTLSIATGSCPGINLPAQITGGRQTAVTYSVPSGTTTNHPATQFADIFGAAFPGIGHSYQLQAVDSRKFVALAFTAPSIPLSANNYAFLNTVDSGSDPNVTTNFTISTTCGDLGTQAAPFCTDSGTANPGTAGVISFALAPAQSLLNMCHLVPGQQYYVNMYLTKTNASVASCVDGTHNCKASFQHNVSGTYGH